MQKTLLILAFIAITFNSFAQRKERLKALKVAFITERLELSSTEAQKFWPVYNAIEDEKDVLRKESRKLRKNLDLETISDNDANTLLESMLDLENKKHQLQNKRVNELLKVIPAKKVILLKIVEDQFNKRMLEEIKKRRERFQNDKNNP